MNNKLDFHYIHKNLTRLLASLDDKTAIPDEMARSLIRLANVVDDRVMHNEFIKPNITSHFETLQIDQDKFGPNTIVKLTSENYPSAAEVDAIKKLIPKNTLIWIACPGDSINLISEHDMNLQGWVKE